MKFQHQASTFWKVGGAALQRELEQLGVASEPAAAVARVVAARSAALRARLAGEGLRLPGLHGPVEHRLAVLL